MMMLSHNEFIQCLTIEKPWAASETLSPSTTKTKYANYRCDSYIVCVEMERERERRGLPVPPLLLVSRD